jgi:predicted ATP-dependent serine protease
MAVKKLNKTEEFLKKYPNIFKRVDDIQIPEILFHPTKTDTPELDNVYSEMGGVVPSCVTMVTGTPGAGKTTLMAVMGSRLVSPRPVVFLSYEMSDFQLKLQAKKIPGFDKMLLVTEPFHKDTEKFEAFLEMLKELNPSMVIADSLQKMAGVMPGSFDKAQIYLAEKFTKFAKDTYIPVQLIGHVNKDGSYKGPTTILHEVDAHLHVSFDKEMGERIFKMGKNRFGGITDPYIFRINNQGVYIGQEWWDLSSGNSEEALAAAKASVMAFKSASSQSEVVPFKAYQEMSKEVMHYLSDKYAEELKNNGVAKTPEIKLSFKGSSAWCQAATAKINFGPKFFKASNSSNFTWTRVGYKREKEFIKRHCANKEDMAMWLILHEFSHLWTGMQHHKLSFFKFIEKFAIEDKWMFSTAQA